MSLLLCSRTVYNIILRSTCDDTDGVRHIRNEKKSSRRNYTNPFDSDLFFLLLLLLVVVIKCAHIMPPCNYNIYT